MTTSGIVVTLPSSSSKSEFPNNKTSSCKIRLPYPLELNGKWEVGLSSITLPDTYLEMSILKELNTFELKTVRNYIGDSVEVPKNNTAILTVTCAIKLLRGAFPGIKNFILHVKYDDIKHSNVITDGISFMKVVINKYEELFMQRRTNYDEGPGNNTRLKESQTTLNTDQKTKGIFYFKWEGDELVIDNKNSPNYEKPEHPYMFVIWNKDLALKMGWITPWPEKNSYRLGSNLIPESHAEYGCAPVAHDLMFRPMQTDKPNSFDMSTLQYYFHLGKNEEQVYLSAECNWRLKNINKAFDHMIGKTAQSFFVYSDVMMSGIVGNKVTDLLREVKYQRTGAGMNYFEPLHIQYLPVRGNIIDTITVEVSDHKGELVKFGGDTIVTLYFKRQS